MNERNKLYYRIGEVASKIGVDAHVIRYWEGEFNIKPHRSSAGQRLYRKHEISLFQRIKTLVYEEGYTIVGAKKIIAGQAPLGSIPSARLEEIKDRLEDTRKKIALFKQNLDVNFE